MLSVLKLFNFVKVFPLSLLTSIVFFAMLFCLSKPIATTTEGLIFGGISFISFILFVLFYTVQVRCMASSLIASFNDDEEPSYGELFQDIKSYLFPILGLILIFIINLNLIIPTIADVAGGLFQVSIMGFDFNVLTLFINLACITWLFVGTAEIVTINASFMDTIKYTFSFVFNNFVKVLGFFVFVAFLLFLFNFTLVSTFTGNQLIMLPIKAIVFAYLFGICNAFAISFFATNVTEEDLNNTPDNDNEDE